MNREFKRNDPNRKIPVRGYTPSTYEESEVQRIAEYIGDSDMRPLLKVYRVNGLNLLLSAYDEFRNLEDVVQMKNPPAFFMYLIKKRKGGGGSTM